jgi:serine/threonine protein kinase
MLRGARVGDYRIRREVRSSGRGTLYVAKNVRSGRDVMLELIEADAGMLAQIAGETRAARMVPHRGIIDVLEQGQSPHGAWVASELLRGESLCTRLKRKNLSADEIALIFTQLIEIVAAFQRMALIHGRLDVSQVVLEETAADTMRVRLLDFGIVRKADKLFGSFEATEKAEAKATAARSALITRGLNVDIYALGKLLADCLPRRLPRGRFAREHQYLRLAKLCMSEEPAKQPRNCDELARLFQLATAKVAPPVEPSQWMYAFVVLALLLAFALVVVRSVRNDAPKPAPAAPG